MQRSLAILLLIVATCEVAAGAATSPTVTATTHLGVAACASPLCHGAVAESRTARVRLDEYRIWLQKDRHARAYQVLLDDRSKRIAENLGIGAPQGEALCLNCHATNVPADKRGPRFQISNGVTCEACHGGAGGAPGAEGWITTHTNLGTQRADNVRRGMYPTEDPVKRAELCLACHLGTDDQFVDHRMMAAGHPRLSFELDTFTAVQPAHFRIDKDYEERKRAHVVPPVQTWAIGQLVTAREYLAALVSPVRGRTGAWPEFTLYDCYSCHQPMRGAVVAERASPDRPALPFLDSASLDLSARALAVIDAPSAAAFSAAVMRLEGEVPSLDYRATVADLSARIATAIAATVRWTPSANDAQRLLSTIAKSRTDARLPLTYAQAEQLTMAAQAIAVTLEPDPAKRSRAKGAETGLDRLFSLTRSETSFDPGKFREALRQVTKTAP